MKQRSHEWFQARLGCVTASNVWRITSKLKSGKPTAEYDKYMMELIAEKHTRSPLDHYTSAAMQWGIDNEPLARQKYEQVTGNKVEEVGFIRHPDKPMGASPDGFVDHDGLVEIKCPTTTTHLRTILEGDIDVKYRRQMQWQMIITDRKWCDFFSFDPRCLSAPYYLERVDRDDILCTNILHLVEQFILDLNQKLSVIDKNIGGKNDRIVKK